MEDNSRTVPMFDLVVQMAVIRMASAVGPTREQAYYPRMCMCVDANSGMILTFEMSPPREEYVSLVLEVLRALPDRIGGLPRQIQLRDPRLARELKDVLEPTGIEVVVRESLPTLDEAVEGMMEFGAMRARGKSQPGLLDVPGMELDHVIDFAEAAEEFYNARPWRHLIDDDLIEIHEPTGPKGARFTQVLGAGGQTFGLGFVASRQDHENTRAGKGLPRGGAWTMQFGDVDHLPFPDGEAWERHNIAVADADAYPSFGRYTKSKGFTQPMPEELAWVGGLLRAIAQTTEEEIDHGQWEKAVETSMGMRTYKLSMPILLEETSGEGKRDPWRAASTGRMSMESIMRAMGQQLQSSGAQSIDEMNKVLKSLGSKPPEFVPTNDAERAQQLCYQAHEARGRRQLQLAREALALDPDCADAMMILAGRISDPEESLPLLERAVEAAARKLGEEAFEQGAGHFWGIMETRPYMRARQALGLALLELGEFDEAIEHFRAMLELNPGDNQGVRYPLAQCLLRSDRLDELDQLVNTSDYADDFGAEWQFTRLLLQYRRTGDSPESRKRFEEANKSNQFVVPILTGRMESLPSPELIAMGGVSEAAMCVEQIGDVWQRTPGALEWLAQLNKKTPGSKKRKSLGKQKRKK